MIQQLSTFRRVMKKFADEMVMIAVNRRRAAALPGKLILIGMPMPAFSAITMIMAVVALTVIDYNMRVAEVVFFDRMGV